MKLTTRGTNNLGESILKHLFYIFAFSKEPVVVEVDDKKYTFGNFDEAFFALNFFRSIKCECCGNCCKNYPLVWDEIHKIDDTIPKKINVNGKKCTLYYIPATGENNKCTWLGKDNLCTRHKERPFLCRMPHIFIHQYTENKVVVMKRQYNRMHSIQCQAKVEYFDYEELTKTDIPNLERLLKLSKFYGINSYYEDIIKFLKLIKPEHGKELNYLVKHSLKRSVSFYSKNAINKNIRWSLDEVKSRLFHTLERVI